jgi:hypothetical protein
MVQHSDIDHTGITGAGGIAATLLDAKGDIIAASAADTAAKLTVGANGTVLTAASGETTGLQWASPAAGGLVAYDINRYTGGDITLNNTTLTAVAGLTDLVVAASSGDVCDLGLVVRATTTTAQSITFDFATIVSAAPVNYVFAASGTPVNIPTTWYIGSAELSGAHGVFPYVVQSGDISGGNVTFRLYFRSSGSRVVEADATAPLVHWVINHGQ